MKKRFNFLLPAALALLVCLTGACRKTSAASGNTAEAAGTAQVVAKPEPQAAAKILATDMIGRELEVPAKPERVITDRILPFPSTYFVAVRSGMEEVVAMHPASKSAAVNSMLNIMAPAVARANTDIFNGNTPNVEEIMKLRPDLVFAYADMEGAIDPYEKAGITALGIRAASAAGGDSIETLRGWFKVLAYTGGDKEGMDSIIREGEKAKQTIAQTLAASSGANPSAVFLFSTTGNNFEIAGGNFFSEYWLKNSGAEDPASKEFQGRKVVNMEQLYAWNPDIIYITNFTSLSPEEIYQNTALGLDWGSLKAVKNKRVHKVPLGIYRWFPPSGDTPLMLYWLAQKNHPELFTYSFEDVLKKYYQEHYGYDLNQDEIAFILNPNAAAAAGYTVGR
ncbi:MAG: ABC transporter substrate-binding protein [Treponema sp.]|jgi:iron complex transport system substrate-binding protein|nr:ABC transporter substrate-binding protein [Treponema sp.]